MFAETFVVDNDVGALLVLYEADDDDLLQV